MSKEIGCNSIRFDWKYRIGLCTAKKSRQNKSHSNIFHDFEAREGEGIDKKRRDRQRKREVREIEKTFIKLWNNRQFAESLLLIERKKKTGKRHLQRLNTIICCTIIIYTKRVSVLFRVNWKKLFVSKWSFCARRREKQKVNLLRRLCSFQSSVEYTVERAKKRVKPMKDYWKLILSLGSRNLLIWDDTKSHWRLFLSRSTEKVAQNSRSKNNLSINKTQQS